jgi:hypothetical protein
LVAELATAQRAAGFTPCGVQLHGHWPEDRARCVCSARYCGLQVVNQVVACMPALALATPLVDA